MTESRLQKRGNPHTGLTNEKSFVFPFAVCAACGAESVRENAKFCAVCGKFLREGYQPLDRLRSSYRMQGAAINLSLKTDLDGEKLFQTEQNSVALSAWACLVYSLVPYLGILFVPFTFCFAAGGYAVSLRRSHLGGKRLSVKIFYLNFLVLITQLFLWHLLYFVPSIKGI